MNNFDQTINAVLTEDWKSLALAGMIGAGAAGFGLSNRASGGDITLPELWRQFDTMEHMSGKPLKHFINIAKHNPNSEEGQIYSKYMEFIKNHKPTDSKEFKDLAYKYISQAGHEGVRLDGYLDGNGKLTIGIGHLVKPSERNKYKRNEYITSDEANTLFHDDVDEHIERARYIFPDFDKYGNAFRIALLDGVYRGDYEIGQKTVADIKNNKFESAAKNYIKRDDYRESQAGIKNRGLAPRLDENAAIIKQGPLAPDSALGV